MIKKFNEHSNEDIYFVYCFLDNRKPGKYIYGDYTFDHEPIYIGKGKGIRPKRHLTLYKNYNTRFYSKISAIIKSGVNPDFILLKENLNESDAFLYEKMFIKLIGRIENNGTLTNLTDGGEGQSGFKFSEESKKKMSEKRLGKKLGPMSDETKLNISLSKMGNSSVNKGKKLEDIVGIEKSLEIKSKQSLDASKRVGIKNPMFGKNHTDDSKLKMSNNRIKKYGEDNPNYGRIYKEDEKTFDRWELTDINGNTIIIDNLNLFCRENSLNASCMRDLYYGRAKKHKIWVKVVKLTDNVKKRNPLN